MSDLFCSFCGKPNDLVLARNGAQICEHCVERANRMLRQDQSLFDNPYDGVYGGILEAARIAESKVKDVFLHLIQAGHA